MEAIYYLNRMTELLNQIREEYTLSSKQLSKLDLEEQDVLHQIENETFNIVRGYYIAKQLKDIRTRRRSAKLTLDLMKILASNLTDVEPEKIEKKLQNRVRQQSEYVYKPRVYKLDG